MAKLKILAGDIKPGTHKLKKTIWSDKPIFKIPVGFLGLSTLDLHKEIESVELQTEESVRSISKTLGWAGVGTLLAGPVGALLGAYAGGSVKEVLFLVHLKDGRKFLGTTDQKTYQHLLAITI